MYDVIVDRLSPTLSPTGFVWDVSPTDSKLIFLLIDKFIHLFSIESGSAKFEVEGGIGFFQAAEPLSCFLYLIIGLRMTL